MEDEYEDDVGSVVRVGESDDVDGLFDIIGIDFFRSDGRLVVVGSWWEVLIVCCV